MLFVIYVVIACHVSTTRGQTVSFALDRSQATCNLPLKLGCFISPFTSTDAVWNRNSVSMSQCGDNGFCSVPSITIDNTTYSFAGNGSGIFVSVTSLPKGEQGVIWSCIHSGATHTYTVSVACSSSGRIGGLSAVNIFCIILGVYAVGKMIEGFTELSKYKNRLL